QLRHEPPATHAERNSNGDLAATSEPARELKIRDVRARDEQNKKGHTAQQRSDTRAVLRTTLGTCFGWKRGNKPDRGAPLGDPLVGRPCEALLTAKHARGGIRGGGSRPSRRKSSHAEQPIAIATVFPVLILCG